MYCSKCGKEYAGDTMICPYCGTGNVASPYIIQPEPQTNVCAVVGFVLSLVSLFLNFLGLLTIAAVVLSAIGLKQIKQSNEKGRGFAIAGLVIGILLLAITVIAVVLIIVFALMMPEFLDGISESINYSM